ncbi:hypothetical protein P0Y35_11780 [Kiritimatiellaeota bacterium B1221]|nr:hypothetical protein [Kiritimatiellaeota bacterium B1221]
MPNLADLVKINDNNIADIDGISDVAKASELLNKMETIAASNGTDHKYLKQVGQSSSAFRGVNSGVTKTTSTDTLVTLNLKVWDASFDADVALAKGYKGGDVDGYLLRETKRSLEGAVYALESQVVAGTDTNGFAGLTADTSMVVVANNGLDTGDTGYATATDTGVTQIATYLIRTAEDGVAVVLGNDGNIAVDAEDPQVVRISDSNGSYPAYYVPALGWASLQQGGKYDVAKVVTSAKMPLTDDLIAEAEAKFKAGKKPNLIVTGSTAKQQLRESRTAVNTVGAPAPIVTESFGIPVVETEAL